MRRNPPRVAPVWGVSESSSIAYFGRSEAFRSVSLCSIGHSSFFAYENKSICGCSASGMDLFLVFFALGLPLASGRVEFISR